MWSSEQTCVVKLVDREAMIDKLVYTATNPVQDHLSPPAIVGTSFTGSTGYQGPTRWSADGSSPCPCCDLSAHGRAVS